MKPYKILAIFLGFTLCACSTEQSLVASPTKVAPTSTTTPRPSLTPSPSPTPFPSPTLSPSKTPSPTEYSINDPRIEELLDQGYKLQPLWRFELFAPADGATFFSTQGEFGNLLFGGPYFDDEDPGLFRASDPYDGITYTFAVLAKAEKMPYLIFSMSSNQSENIVLASYYLPEIDDDFNNLLRISVLPYDWGDINHNEKPDISVVFLWSNNYTGGRVHIFEIQSEDEVALLTNDLPGPMSHWNYSDGVDIQLVMDVKWAEHDCLYPNSPFVFWIYGWDEQEGTFVNLLKRGEINLVGSEYERFLTDLLKPGVPFDPEIHIGPLISLLMLYENSGKRDDGWRIFLELSEESNWPGSGPDALAWLKDDVTHFTNQYQSGIPFTPNFAGNCQ